jgi:flagellar protein FlaG
MEISAISMTPDVMKRKNPDTITSNLGQEKKPSLSRQDNDGMDNIREVSVSGEEITKAIEEINKTLSGTNTKLQISIHDKTREIMVKLINEKTGEVIREIPTEKVLDRIAMVLEEIGLLVDEKA